MGQGIRTAMTQVVAEILKLVHDRVSAPSINTDHVPFDELSMFLTRISYGSMPRRREIISIWLSLAQVAWVYPVVGEYAYTDTPGRWDHWPAAFVFTGGADDGVDGKIVLAPGDVLLPFNSYVREPVTYTIEKGFIQDIRGGLDAELIKSSMAQFDDPRGMGMSHVGWGLDHRAQWHGLTQFPGGMGMELRSFLGNVMFSTGPNNELGGPNDTACHLDIPMRYCNLFSDDEPVVLDGKVVAPELGKVA
jgi:2,5-dihydroxypyridine 5,6-dioxygenase